MTLAEVFNPNIIKGGLESDDKDELFEEMVQVIIDSYSSLSREKLLLALEQREALMSTGIIHDVAVPHGKTDGVKNILGCIGISKKGIDYDSLDRIIIGCCGGDGIGFRPFLCFAKDICSPQHKDCGHYKPHRTKRHKVFQNRPHKQPGQKPYTTKEKKNFCTKAPFGLCRLVVRFLCILLHSRYPRI